MNNRGTPVETYFSQTHSLLYSYLISLPLFLGYEVLIYATQPSPQRSVRIAVDVWFRWLLSYVGHNILSITLIIVALLGVIIIYRERGQLSSLRTSYFLVMVCEGFLYAFLLALLLSAFIGALLQITPPQAAPHQSTLQQIALSLGAGLFEELFFRVILVSALVILLKYIFDKQGLAYAVSMIIAALLFSGAHYIGTLGDTFTLGSFLFRFLFGLALNGIYFWRGFGVAAWTHAIYDIMVVI